MKQHKTKIIAAIIVAVILALSFWWGDGQFSEKPLLQAGSESASVTASPFAEHVAERSPEPTAFPSQSVSVTSSASPMPEVNAKASPAPVSTAPVASPAPVSTASEASPPVETETLSATLFVSCHTVLNHLERLDAGKRELVPADGIILPETMVTFLQGETVFDVLHREMKRAKIHLEFMHTPVYNSTYIEGIYNLYEFDCGDGSGWVYMVNGRQGSCSSSQYILEDGDRIEWVYTCNFGQDIGGGIWNTSTE